MGRNVYLLIGYDVETQERSSKTIRFLKLAPKIHSEYGVSCTFFILGRTLLYHLNEFKRVREKYGNIIDFQQHTYSHILFKNLIIEYRNYLWKKAEHPKKIEAEIEITSDLLNILLNVKCIGLTVPWGCYRGLLDRPDLLQILWDSGIRFVRSWGRNERDSLPVSFNVQPFWYDRIVKEYPPILECPVQGWHDNALKSRLKNRDEYLNYVKRNLDYISEKKLVWGYVQHDHSSFWKDPEMKIVEEMISDSLDRDIKIISYREFYLMKARERGLDVKF